MENLFEAVGLENSGTDPHNSNATTTDDTDITKQSLTSTGLRGGVEGMFGLEGTTTAFHFLAHDWKVLSISFKECDHTLEIESNDDGESHLKCKGADYGAACLHNKSVIVPTHLLHQMSSDALMQYCLDQERLLSGGQCEHNNSSKKLVVSIEGKLCVQLCEKTLKCSHKCRKLCHEDCYPCEEVVVVPFDGCDHVSTMKCFEVSNPRECKELVQLEEPAGCGHIVSLPCHQKISATFEEVLEACTAACGYTGPCGHKCPGTCKTCNQGRFHVRCSHRCDRILDCGHRCDAFCCSPFTNTRCPPCGKPCEASCDHGKCNQKCGMPCTPCMEPCTWKCRHFQCIKLCSEPCDRDVCYAPCEKLLDCGCACIGYCGEACPPICRNCDKEKLSGVLIMGKELEELGDDDRFVFLENCKHTLESAVLEKILSTENESEPVTRLKTCPLCRGVIWNCRPFVKQILQRRRKFLDAKELRYGQKEIIQAIQLECYYKLNVSERSDGHANSRFNAFRTYLLDQFVTEDELRLLPMDQMQQISNLVEAYVMTETCAAKVHKLFIQGAVDATGYEFYLHCVERLFGWVIKRPLPLLPNEGVDFLRESDRILDVVHLITIPAGSPTGNSEYLDSLDVLEDPCAYTRRVRAEFHQRFRRYWIKFCCPAGSERSQATILYEIKMDIKGLKIAWLETSPELTPSDAP